MRRLAASFSGLGFPSRRPASAIRRLALALLFAAASALSRSERPIAPVPSSSGVGSSPGATNPGFDVSGSHPMPNGSDREAPGQGACGCRFDRGGFGAPNGALMLAVLLAFRRSQRRRPVAK
jgi:hypothetical protein